MLLLLLLLHRACLHPRFSALGAARVKGTPASICPAYKTPARVCAPLNSSLPPPAASTSLLFVCPAVGSHGAAPEGAHRQRHQEPLELHAEAQGGRGTQPVGQLGAGSACLACLGTGSACLACLTSWSDLPAEQGRQLGRLLHPTRVGWRPSPVAPLLKAVRLGCRRVLPSTQVEQGDFAGLPEWKAEDSDAGVSSFSVAASLCLPLRAPPPPADQKGNVALPSACSPLA